MELKEAIDTWLSYEDSDRYDEDKVKKVIEARITIREALRSGYTLCKVDEAIERMEEVKQGYYFKEAMNVAIGIVKEACNDSGRD